MQGLCKALSFFSKAHVPMQKSHCIDLEATQRQAVPTKHQAMRVWSFQSSHGAIMEPSWSHRHESLESWEHWRAKRRSPRRKPGTNRKSGPKFWVSRSSSWSDKPQQSASVSQLDLVLAVTFLGCLVPAGLKNGELRQKLTVFDCIHHLQVF